MSEISAPLNDDAMPSPGLFGFEGKPQFDPDVLDSLHRKNAPRRPARDTR